MPSLGHRAPLSLPPHIELQPQIGTSHQRGPGFQGRNRYVGEPIQELHTGRQGISRLTRGRSSLHQDYLPHCRSTRPSTLRLPWPSSWTRYCLSAPRTDRPYHWLRGPMNKRTPWPYNKPGISGHKSSGTGPLWRVCCTCYTTGSDMNAPGDDWALHV